MGVGDGPAGTGGADRPCGVGSDWTSQSARFIFVSTAFPSAPPGNRSRLEPDGGAAAAEPSTNAFTASPQPIESMAMPPTGRRATAPPVAAKPPE